MQLLQTNCFFLRSTNPYSELRKLKTKKTTGRLHYTFHSLFIYSQALQYNMIISEDHILQAELNNLTRILLAHVYPLKVQRQ